MKRSSPKEKAQPKKHLSQNFLVCPHTQERIIKACSLHKEDTILEIGPGGGILTSELAEKAHEVYAVEKDRRLSDLLKSNLNGENIHIYQDDILKFKFSKLPKNLKVIGNLPYHISTPIIEKLIEHHNKICLAYLTVQLEFGQRLAASSGNKSYGALSCFVQYYADVEILFKISKTCFKPVPKVTSCLLKISFRTPPLQAANEDHLFRLIRGGFNQRRKQLINALSGIVPKESLCAAMEQCEISPSVRAENITLTDFIKLSNCMNGEKYK